MALKGIKYVSPCDWSGYGVAARRYMAGLSRCGIQVTWAPMIPGNWGGPWYLPFKGKAVGDPYLDALCNRDIAYDVVVVHMVPEYWPMWAEREPGKPIVGYTVWETDRIPRHWPELLERMDRVLVPCEWNRSVFKDCGVTTPIDVVPHIAATEEPVAKGDFPMISKEAFVFYTIGTWTARKAVGNTIACFAETFAQDEPVALLVKTSRKDFTRPSLWKFSRKAARAARGITRRYRGAALVDLITDNLTEDQIRALHGRGDCYVSLARSEGWGLGAFDAACFGKPVIMTGYGGQLDFLPADIAHLVDFTLVPVRDRMGEGSYTGDQNWAEPDLSHASKLMRRVYADRKDSSARGAALGSFIRLHFAEKAVTDRLVRALEKSLAARPRKYGGVVDIDDASGGRLFENQGRSFRKRTWGAQDPVGDRIPNQFHFVFGLQRQREPFHLAFYLCLASCLQVNLPDRIFFHYHYEPYGRYWDLIKERITPVKVSPDTPISHFRYEDPGIARYRYAHAADFIRLDKLIEHGGIYADIDTLFVRKIPEDLFGKPFVLGREAEVECRVTGRMQPSLCNAFIMSRANSEFAVKWRRSMLEAFDGTWSRHSSLLPQRLSEQHPEWIHVESSRAFYRFMWTPEDLRLLFEECETDLDGVASIHLWSHLWWSKGRRDFSDFHADLITERRIRRLDTTYNVLARPFLPEKGRRGFKDRLMRMMPRPVRRARSSLAAGDPRPGLAAGQEPDT